ncbi:class I SAM-dependent methyltransferase [Mycolicibacterium chubuense]|nr:class I SAM-dependent methyltransferase [Mycolicibacterium chubuense]
MSKLQRLSSGSLQMLKGFSVEPGSIRDLPRWIRDAKIRKAPLEYRRPWWNYNAVAFVSKRLPPKPNVFEYGGGASTLWLLDQGATTITVEDNHDWYRALLARLPEGIDVRFIQSGEGASPDKASEQYTNAIEQERDESFDLVIVDGQGRRECVLAAAPKVKPGGMLLLDDSQYTDHDPPQRGNLTRLRPRYEDLPNHLVGWETHHLRGIKPGTWLPIQTTVLIKPSL